jgi:hypothetical protein
LEFGYGGDKAAPTSGRQADAQGTSGEDAQGTSSCGADGGAGAMGGTETFVLSEIMSWTEEGGG